MYNYEYERWLHSVKDEELLKELESIHGNDEQIKDRFLLSLEFGTAGLRGVLGAGTNRMNIFTVAKATQGLAEFLKSQGKEASVAVSYDSRIKSDVFAKITAISGFFEHCAREYRGGFFYPPVAYVRYCAIRDLYSIGVESKVCTCCIIR